jgi:hypothetical protein
MPTFDGGHYFLTAMIPIRTDTMEDGIASTSPVHALRKRLDLLATAAQTPACHGQSPFAGNQRNHFARFVIVDDVAYNGRDQGNTILSLSDNLLIAQPQDHLSCPFLLFAAEFDAKSGADSERDSYLAGLWHSMGDDLRKILGFCEGFDGRVKNEMSFAKYIADCQLETTMSFNDYYVDPLNLPSWPTTVYKWAGIASAVIFGLGLFGMLFLVLAEMFMPPSTSGLHYAFALTLIGVVALAVVVVAAYTTIMAAGSKPFPTAPDSNLPTVLKALALQRAFTRFAIDNQMTAAGANAASAQQLYDNFAAFVTNNRPTDLNIPTQDPGVIGI